MVSLDQRRYRRDHQEPRRDGGRKGKPVSISAAPADPERPWGSARPEWLRARAEGRLLPDGRIRDDETPATEAGEAGQP